MNALAPTSKLCSIFVFDLISNPLEIKRQHKYIYIYNFSKHYKSTLFQLKKKKLFSDKKKKKNKETSQCGWWPHGLHMYHSGIYSLEYWVYMNITLLTLLPIKSSFSVLKLCKMFDSVSPSTSYTHTHTIVSFLWRSLTKIIWKYNLHLFSCVDCWSWELKKLKEKRLEFQMGKQKKWRRHFGESFLICQNLHLPWTMPYLLYLLSVL